MATLPNDIKTELTEYIGRSALTWIRRGENREISPCSERRKGLYALAFTAVPRSSDDRLNLTALLRVQHGCKCWLKIKHPDGQQLYFTTKQRGTAVFLCRLASHSAPRGNTVQRRPPRLPLSAGDPLDLIRPRASRVPVPGPAKPPKEAPRSRRRDRPAKLAGKLMQLLAEAGLNLYAGEKRSHDRDGARMASVMRQYQLASGVNVPTLLRAPLHWAARYDLKEMMSCDTLWPCGVRPHVAAVLVATSFVGRQVIVSGHRHPWVCGSARDLPVFGRTGPWLLLAAAAVSENDVPIIEAGYAHPILNPSCWFPAESDYERRVTRSVFAFINCCRLRGLKVTVEKPYWPILIDGCPTYPDLIVRLETCARPIYIEVLGTDDPDYLEEKSDQAETLCTVGAYHPVKAYLAGEDENLWSKLADDLEMALFNWLSENRA